MQLPSSFFSLLQLLFWFQLLPLSTSITWQKCASVSTDHGDALHAWLNAANQATNQATHQATNQAENRADNSVSSCNRDSKLSGLRGCTPDKSVNFSEGTADRLLSVLHIDHHSDINVPQRYIPKGTTWQQNRTTLDVLAATADLASFQLSAVWGGLVDRIIWVRPKFIEKKEEVILIDETHVLYYNTTTNRFNSELFSNAAESDGHALLLKKMASLQNTATQSSTYQFNEIRIDQLLLPLEEKEKEKEKETTTTNCTATTATTATTAEQEKESTLHTDTLNKNTIPPNVKELVNLMELKQTKQFILDIDLDYFVPVERYVGSPPWSQIISTNIDTEINPFGQLAIGSCRQELVKDCPNGRWADPTCVVWKVLRSIQKHNWFDISISEESKKLISTPCFQELQMFVKKITTSTAFQQLKCLWNVVSTVEWVLWAKILHDQPSTFAHLLNAKIRTNTKDKNSVIDNELDALDEVDKLKKQKKNSFANFNFNTHTNAQDINEYMMAAAAGTIQMQTMVDELGELLRLLLPAVPVVISIARSTDYWTPVSEYAAIEIAVLRMLHSVYGNHLPPSVNMINTTIDRSDHQHNHQQNHVSTSADSVESFYGSDRFKTVHTFSIEELKNMKSEESMMCSTNSRGATPNVDMINGIFQCAK